MKNSRQAAMGFILVTVFVDVIGWGLIIPVMPTLIAGMKKIPVNEASSYGGWLLSAYAIMQFVCAPILGNLSDKYGRRPVLLFHCLVLELIIYSWPLLLLMDGCLWDESLQGSREQVLQRLPLTLRISVRMKPGQRILE